MVISIYTNPICTKKFHLFHILLHLASSAFFILAIWSVWTNIILQFLICVCNIVNEVKHLYIWLLGFPGGSDDKESACAIWETQVGSLGQEYPLEKGMATHSSILDWEIPWTEEPCGLQSMGSQKSDTVTKQQQHIWFIMLCQSLLYNKVTQLYSYVHIF